MDYEKLAEIILTGIGGEKNIKGFTHCATRLRFTLKDESVADEGLLKKTKGVLGVAKNGGQFQVIIGNEVNKVYAAIQKKLGSEQVESGEEEASIKTKRKPVELIFDFVSAVFTPVLPAIIGAGLVKAVLAIAVLVGINTEGMTYYFLNLIGDAPLYFLPVMLAFTASKKLGCNQFLAVAVAGAMLHPNYAALITDAYNLHFTSFLGMPVALATYSSSVLPVLFMVIAMKFFEDLMEKYLPKTIKFFFKPLLCLLIIAPFTFIVLGPIGFVIGIAVSNGLNALNVYAGWIVPTLIGTFFPLMVTAGMHYGLVPFMMQSIASNGFETIAGPGNLPSNIAQGAASLAVSLKTKDKELKQTALTTGITGVFGITEPALFAVTLKFRRILICVMIGGGLGGLYAGIFGVKCFSFCSPGLLSLATYVGPDGIWNLVHACISMVIAFIVTFFLVFFWGFYDKDGVEEAEKGKEAKENQADQKAEYLLVSPAEGKALPLSEVPDPTFAEEILGKGAAIDLKGNEIYAPISGTIASVFPTGHAICIVGKHGEEILIHVGLDTVQLNGKYFEVKVKEGQEIKQGDLIVTFEREKIIEAGYSMITPVIISNSDDFEEIALIAKDQVKTGQEFLKIR